MTGSEIVSCEIDPVLFIASPQRKIPCSNGTSGVFTVSCAVAVLPEPIQVRQSLRSLSVPVAQHDLDPSKR